MRILCARTCRHARGLIFSPLYQNQNFMGVCRKNHQDPTNRCRVICKKTFSHCKCQSINSKLNSSEEHQHDEEGLNWALSNIGAQYSMIPPTLTISTIPLDQVCNLWMTPLSFLDLSSEPSVILKLSGLDIWRLHMGLKAC